MTTLETVGEKVVCYTATFSVIAQRFRLWGEALRDDTQNNCVAYYEERRKKIGERSEGEEWPLSLLRLPIRLYTVHSIFWHFFPHSEGWSQVSSPFGDIAQGIS